MTVRPSIGKQKKYPHQKLQIIHATELAAPEERAPICWKLITNLAVDSFEDAVQNLQWYALRWKIEAFFKTLKTGCKIEDVRLANCRPAGELHRFVLHRRMADFMAIDIAAQLPECRKIRAIELVLFQHCESAFQFDPAIYAGKHF